MRSRRLHTLLRLQVPFAMAVLVVVAALSGGGTTGAPSGAPPKAPVFASPWPYPDQALTQMKDGWRRSSIQSASEASPTIGSIASHAYWP